MTRLFQLVVGKGIASGVNSVKTLASQPGFTADHLKTFGLPLPSRVTQEKLSIGSIHCLKPNIVQELTEMFGDASAEGKWQAACMAGMHVLAIYVPVYGWRHPLVGELSFLTSSEKESVWLIRRY
jgi:hypothetical protein